MAEVGAWVRDLAGSEDWLQAPISPAQSPNPCLSRHVWLKQNLILGSRLLPVGACGPGSAALLLSCYRDTRLGPICLQGMDGDSGVLGSCAHPAGDLL